jgi:hypothetical protein
VILGRCCAADAASAKRWIDPRKDDDLHQRLIHYVVDAKDGRGPGAASFVGVD